MKTPDTVAGLFGVVVLLLIVIAFALTLAFAIYAGLTWIICWAFGIPFMWKYAFGLWAIMVILHIAFKKK